MTLPAGSRIRDAVEAAGGFDETADTAYVNLAAELQDAWQIRIPTEEEAAALRGGADPTAVYGAGSAAASSSAASSAGTMVLILSTSLIALSSVSGFSFSWQTAATDLMTLLDFSNTTSGFLDGQDITIYKAFLSGGTVLRMLCTSFGIGLCWLLGGFAFFRKRDIS